MSQTYTHKDLARKLKVSETTIKSYRRKFPECIPVASSGKPIRFLPEAVAVATRIRDLFDLGMSVEEVRGRLSQEFPWISLVARDEPQQAQAPGGMPQEFTIALSNLAKSMVTLLQQQGSIMDRMDRLEATVAEAGAPREGGVQTADFKAVLEDLQGYLRNALMPLQQLQRLNEVQGVTEVLHQAAANMVDAAQIMRSLADRAKGPSGETEASSKIVQFPSTAAAPQPAPAPQNMSQDPPRAFLLKPMVVRTMEGTYIGAGGKSRGRFTLNDFKALLVYGRQPGEHFSLHWEQVNNDWVATLTQPGAEKPGKWRLQLKEAMSQSGVGVVELVGFATNDENVHPAEFVGFVGSLSGGE
ncbi:MerR family transcriptional regulator [uncultured delta proteobacterium]|uniref:MerR family transcriptional regulator n=1 Tax=uncultured delta proteobacterium TaxID=34034 RepID=A0A212JYJ0_9DELT|nr:MerR family transcriptional regulator [uncultured delta proteobacterium]